VVVVVGATVVVVVVVGATVVLVVDVVVVVAIKLFYPSILFTQSYMIF
jgi:hypothetical protein